MVVWIVATSFGIVTETHASSVVYKYVVRSDAGDAV
jgi:hypothetical protein